MDPLLSAFAKNYKEIESNNDKRINYLITGYIRIYKYLSNLKNIVIPKEIEILLIIFYGLQEDFDMNFCGNPKMKMDNKEYIISNNNYEPRMRCYRHENEYIYGKIICESPFKYKWIFEIIDINIGNINNDNIDSDGDGDSDYNGDIIDFSRYFDNDHWPQLKIGIRFIEPYKFRKNKTGINNHLESTFIGYQYNGWNGSVTNYIEDPNPGGYEDIIRNDILSEPNSSICKKGDKIEMNLDLEKYLLSYNINGEKMTKPVAVMKNHKYKLWIDFNFYTLKLLYFTAK